MVPRNQHLRSGAVFGYDMVAMTDAEPPSDAALVAGWQTGDERAAAEIVRRHQAVLGRFLYGAGAGRGELDDLVQETFFRAFRGLGSWHGGGSLRSWLFTIASNLLRDEYRRNKGRQVVSIEDRDIVDRDDPHAQVTANETGIPAAGLEWRRCPGCSVKCS